MRLLLDENLPKRLKQDFVNHRVFTVRDMGWNGIKNGELLKLLLEKEFDALLTFDKNLQHQQNFQKYSIAVFILSAKSNTYEALTPLIPKVILHLNNHSLNPGATIISENEAGRK